MYPDVTALFALALLGLVLFFQGGIDDGFVDSTLRNQDLPEFGRLFCRGRLLCLQTAG